MFTDLIKAIFKQDQPKVDQGDMAFSAMQQSMPLCSQLSLKI